MERFKFRIYDIKLKMYRSDGYYINGNQYMDSYFEDVYDLTDDMIVEQCTGLKDKNGNLIYENDIVLGASGFRYCIIWSEMEVGWALQNLESKVCIAMNAFTADEIEIIGNIHEQKEQQ